MPSSPTPQPRWAERGGRARRDESGFSVIEYTMMVSLSFLVLVWGANLILWSYGKGVVHSAVDQAARAGSRVDVDSAAVCEARAQEVLGNILSGSMGSGVQISCSETDGVVRALARVTFAAWLPPLTDSVFEAAGQAVKERAP